MYVAYFDAANGDLKCARSTDGGATFSVATVDTGGSSVAGQYTSIAASGAEVHISCYDATSGDLKYAGSQDYGASWAEISTVISSGTTGQGSRIAVDGARNYIACWNVNGFLDTAVGKKRSWTLNSKRLWLPTHDFALAVWSGTMV